MTAALGYVEGDERDLTESSFQILSIHGPIRLTVKQMSNIAPFPALIIHLRMRIF